MGQTLPLRVLFLLLNPGDFAGSATPDAKSVVCAKILSRLIIQGNLQYHVHQAILKYTKSTIDERTKFIVGRLVTLGMLPFFNSFLPPHVVRVASEDFTLQQLTIPHLIPTFLPASYLSSVMVPALGHILLLPPNKFEYTEVSPAVGRDRKGKSRLEDKELPQADPREVEQAKALLENLGQIAGLVVAQQKLDISTAYMHVISKLLAFLSFTCKSGKQTTDEVFSDDEDDEMKEPMEDDIMEQTLGPIQVLLEPGLLRSFFSLCLPQTTTRTHTDRKKPFVEIFPSGLVHLVQMCDTVQKNNENIRKTVINTLTFSTPCVRVLWDLLSNSIEFTEFVESGLSSKMSVIISVVSLFCVCYSNLLVSLDDDEFFKHKPFTIDEVKSISLALKRIVFRMYWVKGNRDELPVYQDPILRKSITSVLHQLYDRNSRHQYCLGHHWETDEIMRNSNQFMLEVQVQEKRALRILKHIPFVVPCDMRVRIFQTLVEQDKELYEEYRGWSGSTHISIRRAHVLEDGFSSLNNRTPEEIKGSIKVSFINSEGLEEAGVDGGGVFKEFVTELSKKAFTAELGLFRETQDRLLYPNPLSEYVAADHLAQFEFIGRVLGKAMYENILIDVPFANFFLAKLLRKHNYYNDLVFLDPDLHKHMLVLKNYSPERVEDDLALNFVIAEDRFGEIVDKELVPGGKDIYVTAQNRLKYIFAIANYRLNTQIARQSRAFLKGFTDLIKPEWLRMFNQHELHLLINGRDGGLDLVDMRQHTNYAGGYHEGHPVIDMFWRVVESFSPEEQRRLLKFATSCSRPPLLGFRQLQPPFAIHQASDDTSRLPTAATCMNLLKLAPYTSFSQMKEKLLYAINSAAGFELS
eukprot:TRINITY_DN5363_c0_g1_i2.p1 TRINITY_DN5363_c0_g1~~TRINITY_DN5363_c0_g1_i2.p1  ORF type:complete len:863 (-),score=106.25 TRINITY_DN5363_c0_g1_i2:130-2718(-)